MKATNFEKNALDNIRIILMGDEKKINFKEKFQNFLNPCLYNF